MDLKARLDKLEAHPAFAQQPEPEVEPTADEIAAALCDSFEVAWLRIDDQRRVVADAKSPAHHRDWLLDAARELNRVRLADDGTLAPIFPMILEDAAAAADMLRKGWIRLVDGSFCTDRGKRLNYFYRLPSKEALQAMDMARKLDMALNVYEASGGAVEPFTVETIVEVLESIDDIMKR